MTFEELKIELSDCSSLSFPGATQRLQERIYALDRAHTIQLVSQIGAIPEDIVTILQRKNYMLKFLIFCWQNH